MTDHATTPVPPASDMDIETVPSLLERAEVPTGTDAYTLLERVLAGIRHIGERPRHDG
jgi:hypothetical protein